MEKSSQVIYNPYKNKSQSKRRSVSVRSTNSFCKITNSSDKKKFKVLSKSRQLSSRRKARLSIEKGKNYSVNAIKSFLNQKSKKSNKKEPSKKYVSKNRSRASSLKTTKNTFFSSLNSGRGILNMHDLIKSKVKINEQKLDSTMVFYYI